MDSKEKILQKWPRAVAKEWGDETGTYWTIERDGRYLGEGIPLSGAARPASEQEAWDFTARKLTVQGALK